MRFPLAISAFALVSAAAVTGGGALREAHAVAALGPEFDGVDVKNKLGQPVDQNIPFTSPDGKTVTLADYLDGKSPVLFTLNYFRCTSICSVQLNALVTSLRQAGWEPGREKFRIVTVSFDPRDTVEVAAGKQATYREELVRLLAEDADEELDENQIRERAKSVDWTFLVAREKSVRAILDNVGYSVKFDERAQQYAHSPVAYVLSPTGVINRYLWGIEIPSRDLRFALMESSNGELGSFGEKILLSCFDYNRDHGGYEAFAWGVMRLGGLLVAVVFGTWLILHWRREKKRAQPAGPALPSSPSESRT